MRCNYYYICEIWEDRGIDRYLCKIERYGQKLLKNEGQTINE